MAIYGHVDPVDGYMAMYGPVDPVPRAVPP